MPPKRKKNAVAKAAAAKAESSLKTTAKTTAKTIPKSSSAPSTSKVKATSPPRPSTRSSPAPEPDSEEFLPPKTPTKLKDKSQPKARAYQYYLLSRILANLIEIENQERRGDGFYEEVADATRAVEGSLIDLYENGRVIDEWVHDGEKQEQEMPSPKKRASGGRRSQGA